MKKWILVLDKDNLFEDFDIVLDETGSESLVTFMKTFPQYSWRTFGYTKNKIKSTMEVYCNKYGVNKKIINNMQLPKNAQEVLEFKGKIYMQGVLIKANKDRLPDKRRRRKAKKEIEKDLGEQVDTLLFGGKDELR